MTTTVHINGWVPEAIDPTNTPPQFLADMYAEVSPDGTNHFPIVVAKLVEIHLVSPPLTDGDLASHVSR
jgi:hypothetical protein